MKFSEYQDELEAITMAKKKRRKSYESAVGE